MTNSKTVKIKHAEGPPVTQNVTVVGDNAVNGSDSAVNGLDGGVDYIPQLAVAKKPRTPTPVQMGAKRIARSGSLVERVEHVGGVPKTVIETTSSSDDEGEGSSESGRGRKRNGRVEDESSPLLGGRGS